MRRTYKSKKDTGGTLDYKDMLCNMDEKSSVFDAFYIQNIKHTKREQSCISSSNNYGAASNRVRKRKYVKRLVKDVEPATRGSLRESISASVFLTPDKSIRVNKAPDLFDQLLNSSPPREEGNKVKKVDIFDQVLIRTPKETKTYNRKKNITKKFNYSLNESSVSEKENSNKNNESTHQNASDINAHKLIIQKEPAASPIFDESINNIVKKLSLLNKVNGRGSSSSLKKTFKLNKNRLTKNFQSPLVKTSPLSSTPMTDKARSQSIYKFSPIPMGNLDESPQNMNETEDEVNKSIVFFPKNISNAFKRSQDEESHITHTSNKGGSNPLFSSEADTQENVVEKPDINYDSPVNNSPENLLCVQVSSLSTTEMEPFLGFSEETVAKVKNDIFTIEEKDDSIIISTAKVSKSSQKSKEENNAEDKSKFANTETNNIHEMNASIIEYSVTPEPFLGFTEHSVTSTANDSLSSQQFISLAEAAINNENYEQVSQEAVSDVENKSAIDVDSDDDFEEHYDHIYSVHDSQQILHNNNSDKDISTTLSSFSSYNEHHDQTGTEDKIEQKRNLHDEDNNVEYSRSFQEDDDDEKQSLYDTCNSDTSSHESISRKVPVVALERINMDLFNKYYKKFVHSAEPKVVIEKMDIESLKRYYEKMPNYSQHDEIDRLSDDDIATEDIDEKELSEDLSDSYKIDEEDLTGDASEYYASFDDTNNSTDSENSLENCSDSFSQDMSYEKEKCVNFITTRRKNGFTNNSDILILDDSQASTSTECDRTVLSNNKISLNSSKTDKNNISVDEAEEYAGTDSNESECNNTRLSNRTTRNSKLFKLSKVCNVSNTSDFKDNSVLLSPDDSQASTSTDCDKTVISNEKISLANPKTDLVCADANENNDSILKEEESIDTNVSNVTTRNSKLFKFSNALGSADMSHTPDLKSGIILQPGKRWERSLSIYRRMTMNDHFDHSILEDEEDLQTKGRKYRQSVICTMEMQEKGLLHNESIHNRRSTFVSKPSRSTIRIVKETNTSRLSLSSTAVFEDLKGFIEDCDDTIVELSKLSLIDDHDVTVIEKLHESTRNISARDYVLRRCNQSDTVPFDECYPDSLLKNCRKIGEGVYGEVYLWRAPDGRARVMKVVPIAGTIRVNGERQKDFHEIISEIVIAMELSALRAPIADIDCHFKEGKDVDTLDLHSVENATDVFNEVLAVRCVYGSYSLRLLDLWELYDETVGSENDNPAILPVDQQYIVLELANAGQDLESYQFNNAEQAYALFQQVAFALAVGEESFQFEHRDLHWGNVLIAPTDQKYATFVLRGRCHRVERRGVAATIIDYSLSRISVNIGGSSWEQCALYNDLAADEGLFTAVGDYQFQVYRLMRDKLGNDWKNFEPYTNILWLHYTVDKMITALRYKRTTTKTHKQYINKLKGIKERLLGFGSAAQFVLTDNDIY